MNVGANLYIECTIWVFTKEKKLSHLGENILQPSQVAPQIKNIPAYVGDTEIIG